MARTIGGEEAWLSLVGNKHARWGTDLERFSTAPLRVKQVPKFKFGPDDSFFCIGSCFARNIEEHLIYRGRSVLSKRIISPAEEWSARANGIVNKFTTHSMVNLAIAGLPLIIVSVVSWKYLERPFLALKAA